MKTRKLIWLVSLAVLAGLASMAAVHPITVGARPEMRVDGGAPVPPPPPLPPSPGVFGITA